MVKPVICQNLEHQWYSITNLQTRKVIFILVCKMYNCPKKNWTSRLFCLHLEKLPTNLWDLLRTKNSLGTYFYDNSDSNTDVRKICIFFITTTFFQWLMNYLYAQWIMTSVLSLFPMHLVSIARFPKEGSSRFLTASVLTKLSMEKAIAKPQKCSITNSETLLWTFAWYVFKIFLKFKKELVFPFKASRNLRSKSYQLVGVSYILRC